MTPQKNRIWELDALRGICILGMMVVHFVFDLNEFAGLGLTMPGWFDFCQRYGTFFSFSSPASARRSPPAVSGAA